MASDRFRSPNSRRAGAAAPSRWGAVRFLARRYPLGAIGAVIMALFVFAAIFADFIGRTTRSRPTPRIAGAAEPAALARLRLHGPRRLQPDHLWRAHLARGRHRLDRRSARVRRHDRAASGYLGGWFDLVIQRLTDILQSLPLLVMALVMAAALGPSLHNTIIAIAIPLIPICRARHPRQHAVAARAAVCRGRAGRSA